MITHEQRGDERRKILVVPLKKEIERKRDSFIVDDLKFFCGLFCFGYCAAYNVCISLLDHFVE